jgi:hypothetical protein
MLFGSHEFDVLDKHANVGGSGHLMRIGQCAIDRSEVGMEFLKLRVFLKKVEGNRKVPVGILH